MKFLSVYLSLPFPLQLADCLVGKSFVAWERKSLCQRKYLFDIFVNGLGSVGIEPRHRTFISWAFQNGFTWGRFAKGIDRQKTVQNGHSEALLGITICGLGDFKPG